MPNWTEVRADFPALEQLVGNQRLIYLDNAATTQKPRQVIEAMEEHYRTANANVHRAVHMLAERATAKYEGARKRVASFLNAASDSEIVFVRGTTEGLNLIAHAYCRHFLAEGDEVLVSEAEHHSNLVPWQMLAQQTGVHLRVLEVDSKTGEPTLNMGDWLTPKTKLWAFQHVSNVLGHANPVEEWCSIARRRGVLTVIDAAQSVGHMPVDVQKLDCDFLVFSGHKCCGPSGIGAVYGKSERWKSMPPWMGGGEMIDRVSTETFTAGDPPHRFEAGTPAIEAAAGLGSALGYLEKIGLSAIERRCADLAQRTAAGLSTLDGIRFLGNPSRSKGVLSFTVDGVHAFDLASFADHAGVALRAGHHCAQPLMARLGVDSALRASFFCYNTEAESDQLVTIMDHAIRSLR